VKTAAAGDPLGRLRDEQHQIDELLQTHARQQRDPNHRPAEAPRLAALIITLLRVHIELESRLLHTALVGKIGTHSALERAADQRTTVADAIERVEALSPRDPEYSLEMDALARRVRRWFASDEEGLYPLVRDSGLDLSALDHELATRQEALLSAGPAS
jgi:hypothetical protein